MPQVSYRTELQHQPQVSEEVKKERRFKVLRLLEMTAKPKKDKLHSILKDQTQAVSNSKKSVSFPDEENSLV